MASKEQKPSKKAVKEKQKKAIEDSTFGLKNKNKSKKVQQFINRVEKSVKYSNGGLEATKAKELKKETKLMKQLQEEEMRQLFNEAIGNQFGVKKSKAQNNAQMLGLTAAKKEVVEFLDALSSDSSDSDSDDEDPRNKQYEVEIDEPVAVEIFREKTIEDIIEEQRAKLAAEGKKGTPVTAESFAKWRAEKLAKKQAEAEARLKAEQTKKKGGKGLSVLSGKELFSYNASLFVDDDSAFDTSNDKTINEEIKALAQQEEERLKEETAKAQAEQLRLFEMQKLEIEARAHRERLKKENALAANHPTFVFYGVVVNQLVFQEDDDEDLEFFTDLPLPTPKSAAKQESEENEESGENIEQAMDNLDLNEEGNEAGGNDEEDGEEEEEDGDDNDDS